LALAIRLKRMGRKKKPFYRIIVIDERNPRQGRAVDDLGYYNPMTEPNQIEINTEKSLVWLKEGAKPSQTVRSLLSKAGVLKTLHEQKYKPKEDQTETVEQSDSEQEEP